MQNQRKNKQQAKPAALTFILTFILPEIPTEVCPSNVDAVLPFLRDTNLHRNCEEPMTEVTGFRQSVRLF